MRIIFSVLLAAMPLLSWAPDRGRQVMDETLKALGGEKFRSVEDRVESGRAYSFYRERLSGLSVAKIYTRYLTPPEPPTPDFFGVRERQAFGKNEDYGYLFNELGGWDVTFRGARPMPEDILARYRDTTRRNIFYILRERLGEPGMVFDYRGTDIIENQPVEIVDITDAENRTVTVYINRTTRLPVRQVYIRRDPKTGVHQEITYFSKYRDVGGGVMWPFAIERERDGEKIYQMFADAVTINSGLKDDLFTLSADTKLLKPAR
ncbi:MAG: hypothetical protein ACE15B_22385 [Bryobacteraceae bacterium]